MLVECVNKDEERMKLGLGVISMIRRVGILEGLKEVNKKDEKRNETKRNGWNGYAIKDKMGKREA